MQRPRSAVMESLYARREALGEGDEYSILRVHYSARAHHLHCEA